MSGLYCLSVKVERGLGSSVDSSLLLALDLIGSIYDSVIEPDKWVETLDRVRIFLQLHNAMLSVTAVPAGNILVHASSNISPDLLQLTPELGEEAVAIWGGMAMVATLPLETPLVHSAYTAPETWVGNGYFELFAKPQHVVDEVMLILERNPALVATVGFAQHETMPPISKSQTRALAILAPHFRRAAIMGGLLADRTAAAGTFGSVIDALKVPVLLVRADLSVIHQNTMASRLISRFPMLRGADGKLSFPGEIVAGQIAAAVKAAALDSEGLAHGAGIPFRPANRKSLIAHVLPLKRRSSSPEPSAVAALFVIDPAAPIDYPLDTVRLVYGLRPAEVRVLDLTLRGLTGPQIAGELSVAPSTVKTHMQALFDKFGVSNKVGLVSAVFAATQTVLS